MKKMKERIIARAKIIQ